jgi:hypothetical protein
MHGPSDNAFPDSENVVVHPDVATEPSDKPVRTHQDVLELIADVERQLERLRGAQMRSAEELAHFTDRSRRLDEREAQLDAMAQSLGAEAGLVRERSEAIEAKERELVEREAAIAICERSLADQEQSFRDRAAAVAQGEAAIASEQSRLAAEQEALARAKEEFEVESARRAEERGAVEAELSSLRERIAAAESNEASMMLTITQLRERSLDADESLRSRDAVVEAKDRALAERDTRINELEREVGMVRQSLQTAGEKLSALAKSVADSAPQLERGASAIALLNEYRQRIDSQDTQISQLQKELATARQAALAAPQTVIERVVETVVDTSALEAARGEIDRLREEIAASQRAADEARQQDAVQSSATSEQESAIADTQAKLEQAVAFLASRKRRVDLAKRLLRERKKRREIEMREATENAMVRVLEEERLVKKQREELRHVQEVLSTSERTMMSRYARHRGGLVAAWVMIVMVALAAGAWYAAPAVMPGAAVASVDLVAKTRDGSELTPEADVVFQSVHREALADEGLRMSVRKRLIERGINAFKGSGDLTAWFDAVRVDSDGIGSLRLVAEGPDPQTAVMALDTLATTLVNESPKLAKGKADVPRISITGNSQVPGRMTFSMLVPQQGPWDRFIATGMLFSGIATIGLVGGAFVFARIAASKRRFEDAERFGAHL